MKKAFDCTWCGKRHDFDLYVFAHWRDVLVHVCNCEAKHSIVCGTAQRTRQGKKSKRKI